jgi:hypothetical protein
VCSRSTIVFDVDTRMYVQEDRIADLELKNEELEKFKYVLNYKVQELERLIRPREEEIERMRNQLLEVNKTVHIDWCSHGILTQCNVESFIVFEFLFSCCCQSIMNENCVRCFVDDSSRFISSLSISSCSICACVCVCVCVCCLCPI